MNFIQLQQFSIVQILFFDLDRFLVVCTVEIKVHIQIDNDRE